MTSSRPINEERGRKGREQQIQRIERRGGGGKMPIVAIAGGYCISIIMLLTLMVLTSCQHEVHANTDRCHLLTSPYHSTNESKGGDEEQSNSNRLILGNSIRGGSVIDDDDDDDFVVEKFVDDDSTDDSTDNNNNYNNRTLLSARASLLNTTQHQLSTWKNETTEKAKRLFLDKITFASTLLLKKRKEDTAAADDDDDDNDDYNNNMDDDQVTMQSDLLRPGRSFHIVTTATIPWFTGTAVNPLLRAAYLCRLVQEINNNNNSTNNIVIPKVTLVIPWLELEEDRMELYGNQHNFTTPQEQEQYIRNWLRNEAEMPNEAHEVHGIKIVFYPARYHAGLKSIFAMGDIVSLLLHQLEYDGDGDGGGDQNIHNNHQKQQEQHRHDLDVCILEEPEHLNFYRAPGQGWTKQFNYVIGIIHTNYVEYASSHYSGLWTAPAIKAMSSAMVRAYCHVVIKLSDTLQTFAEEKERTSNVHGVRSEFIKEGLRRGGDNDDKTTSKKNINDNNNNSENSNSGNNHGQSEVYFIGKLLWTKGLDGLLEMQSFYKKYTGKYFSIDIYGNGPDERAIKKAFHGRSQIINTMSSIDDDNDDESTDDIVSTTTSSTSIVTTATSDSMSTTKPLNSNYNVADDDERSNSVSLVQNKSNTNHINIGQQITDNRIISHHVSKLSKQIQATTQTLKSTTESIVVDMELPQSLHEYRRTPIPAQFMGRIDHAKLTQYKVFVNPSLSEVLCTTTAEALAMGKFAIIPVHPSNQFFLQFPNCLAYRNRLEFSANLSWALSHDPEPLSHRQRQLFTWEEATNRFVQASAITRGEAKERQKLGTSTLDERIAWFHNEIGNGVKGDILRKVFGAGPAAEQVKYLKSQSLLAVGDEDNGEEDEAIGLSTKFLGSSLADSLKKTFSNGIFAPDGALS